MGADYLGWRNCSLQAPLGKEGFLRKLKLRAYRRVIEEKVPKEQRDSIRLRVDVLGRGATEMTYPGILEQLGAFEAGAPECKTCPLGNGAPLDCYRYVSYPVDEIAERAIFGFFTSLVAERDSIANQLYRDIASRVPEDSDWYTNRGEDGMLATLDEPLIFEWDEGDETLAVDSAQILAATFFSLEHPAVLVAYGRYFHELLAWLDRQIGIQPAPVGKALEQSRTLLELREISPMITAAVPYALTEGWEILVDG